MNGLFCKIQPSLWWAPHEGSFWLRYQSLVLPPRGMSWRCSTGCGDLAGNVRSCFLRFFELRHWGTNTLPDPAGSRYAAWTVVPPVWHSILPVHLIWFLHPEAGTHPVSDWYRSGSYLVHQLRHSNLSWQWKLGVINTVFQDKHHCWGEALHLKQQQGGWLDTANGWKADVHHIPLGQSLPLGAQVCTRCMTLSPVSSPVHQDSEGFSLASSSPIAQSCFNCPQATLGTWACPQAQIYHEVHLCWALHLP